MSELHEGSATVTAEAEAFYSESLKLLIQSGIPFLLGGTYVVSAYTGINRPTKDIDVFCCGGDFPRILSHFQDQGFETEIEHILAQAGVRFLDGAPQEIGGVGFAGVKGFGGGFGNRMLDSFGEPAIKQFVHEAVNEAMRLESALRQLDTERVFVVLHYAPIAATVEGEPTEIFPFLGSSRLAETIDRFDNVRAVAHGHAHHGTYSGKTLRGTPVYNVAQTIPKETGRPYALIEV